MTRDEAKLLLGLFRPDQDDPADPLFAGALSLLATDAELAAWSEREKALDREMRDAVRDVAPPSGLRDSLLAENKIVRPSRFSSAPWLVPALAIAAALAVLISLASLARPVPVATDPALAALTLRIPALTGAHDHAKSTAGSLAPLRSWLAEHGGSSGFTVPKGLQNAAGVACEVTSVEDRKVTILCFDLGGKRHPHLYVVDTHGIKPGADGRPTFFQIDGVSVASWSQGGLTYFLAERASLDAVRHLL
ncbi:MAG: hypothetical protein WC003_08755 [Terrimicrobiaceae bacterium]